MKHIVSQKLFSYWNNLRGKRFAPYRLEIEPGCIGSILADTFILERKKNDSYTYRLAGTQVCQLFGKELRGQNFLSGWNLKDIKALLSRLNAISIQGGAGLFAIEFENVLGEAVLGELLLLPLLHMNVYADRYLGSLGLFNKPLWMQYEPLINQKLISDKIIEIPTPPSQIHQDIKFGAVGQSYDQSSRLVIKKNRAFRVFEGGLSESKATHFHDTL